MRRADAPETWTNGARSGGSLRATTFHRPTHFHHSWLFIPQPALSRPFSFQPASSTRPRDGAIGSGLMVMQCPSRGVPQLMSAVPRSVQRSSVGRRRRRLSPWTYEPPEPACLGIGLLIHWVGRPCLTCFRLTFLQCSSAAHRSWRPSRRPSLVVAALDSMCRRRRSTWHWHGPVDGRTRCLLPSTPAMVPRTHHPSSPDASSSGPWQHVPAPLPPPPPWPSLPRHRSGAQLSKLMGSSSEHLKPAIPSSQNCIMPSGLHFNISSASSSLASQFLGLVGFQTSHPSSCIVDRTVAIA